MSKTEGANHNRHTTPFHVACDISNEEAVWVLIEKHEYDPNILLQGISPLFMLLNKQDY